MSNIYNNYISTHYSNVNKDIKLSYEKRLNLFKSYLTDVLPKNKASAILEIGCGMGHNLYSLKKLGYNNILGIDISAECVDYCKINGYRAQKISSTYSFYTIPKNQKRFDYVIIYDLLEHFETKDARIFLGNVKRVLKNRGKILISIPNAEYPLNLNLFYSDITHKFMYNRFSMEQLLSTSGYKSLQYKYINSFTLYDNNVLKKYFKSYLILPLSILGESFWKLIGYLQGVYLTNPKPTIFCLVEFKNEKK